MSSNLKAFVNVTLSFLPLMFLWSIPGKFGLVLGLASTLILFIRNMINRNIGIMPCVLLAYFIVINLFYFYFKMDSVIHYKYLSSYIVLALTGFISIMAGKPYTMYDAKSGYREGFGKSPLFIDVNIVITKMWASIYLINAVIELIGHNTATIVIMNILVAIGILLSIMIPAALPKV